MFGSAVVGFLALLLFAIWLIVGVSNTVVRGVTNDAPSQKPALVTNIEKLPDGANGTSTLNWSWRYDSEGRPTEIVGPGSTAALIHYEGSDKTGAKTTTTTVEFRDESRTFVIDSQGRLLRGEAPGGDIAFHYGSSGLPIEVRSSGAPTLRYRYDVWGNLVELQIGKATTIGYRYDYLGRLTTTITPAGEITYKYHRASNTIVRRLPNGIESIRKFDDEGELVELTHVDSRRRILAQYAYTYRPDGLLRMVSELSYDGRNHDCTYDYDVMQRLTGVACQGGDGRSYHYKYDALGNLAEAQSGLEETLHFTSTPTGALMADNRGSVHLDARGHVRQLPTLPKAIDYKYNGAGELITARGAAVGYTYNALGLLTKRLVEGRTTAFLPDPFTDAWRPLWRRDADSAETIIVWDGAVPLMELRDGNIRYRLEDHLASVRVELNGSGDLTSQRDYSPYGAPLWNDLDSDLVAAFAGLIWDPVAEVYLAKARAYDSTTGRFLQPDPILRVPGTSKHSHSLYAYASGDPVNFVDRNGAEAQAWMLDAGNGNFSSGLSLPKIYSKNHPRYSHHDRNNFYNNKIPYGSLWQNKKPVSSFEYVKNGNNTYFDDRGTKWTLLPPGKSVFHSISGHKTYKFISIDGRGSHEAILAIPDPKKGGRNSRLRNKINFLAKVYPNGYWDRNSPSRGTYNKADESVSTWSHIVDDMMPHFLPGGSNYNYRAPDRPYGLSDNTSEFRSLTNKMMSDIGKMQQIQRQYDTTGREGLIAGPGGFASSGSKAALAAWNASRVATPSPVGGVSLAGGAKALVGLGHIKGVAVDKSTGRLILIGGDGKNRTLPPLHLDDVVTVFRAIYDHGKAPSVTIDPDKTNPQGSTMDVKHGPGTDDTYVGWVLFQCDRIMKSYQLGKDNVTKEHISSRVPGYESILNAVFFGKREQKNKNSNWERFWIKPTRVARYDAGASNLSLFDLPLQIETQKMRWENGQLVDDEKGKSSDGAIAFKLWFTEKYSKIADEVVLIPPPGNGRDQPVAIFHELKRIALVSAVAERLRDLGEAMPVWMRDYRVAEFSMDTTTPSLTERRYQSDGRGSEIYGGVNLAPDAADVHAYAEANLAESHSLLQEDASFFKESRIKAEMAIREIPRLARTASSPISINRAVVTSDGAIPSMVTLPGATTRSLAPNRQSVTDMTVPIGLGRSIRLTRFYNSFFDPEGSLGKGWTFDLPRLLKVPVPLKSDSSIEKEMRSKEKTYRPQFHLVSPLGTINVRFNRAARVEPFGELTVAPNHPEISGVGVAQSDVLKAKTIQLLFRDGTVWHFGNDTYLMLVESDGSALHYVRDKAGHLTQIVGFQGKDVVAKISLQYDQFDRIIGGVAEQIGILSKQAPAPTEAVEFKYDVAGRLSTVSRPSSSNGTSGQVEWTYAYEANRLSRIGGDNKQELSFGYDDQARLRWQQSRTHKIEYTISETQHGSELSVMSDQPGDMPVKWAFDQRMRPSEAQLSNGGMVRWRYGKGREVRETHSHDGVAVFTRLISSDGQTETTNALGGPLYQITNDTKGRTTKVSVDDVPAAQLSWQPDGRIASVQLGKTVLRPRRDRDGRPTGILISAPHKNGKSSQWLEEKWDFMGRLVEVTDSSGFIYATRYDDRGRISEFGRLTRSGELQGTQIVRNNHGKVTQIKSLLSLEKLAYSNAGDLITIETERAGTTSVTTLGPEGRLKKYVAFDGGITSWVYRSEEEIRRLQTIVLPSGLRIDYRSLDNQGTGTEEVRLGPSQVKIRSDNYGRIASMAWGAAE
ncbi:RHS repeat-associated core domain-containing protein [Pelagibius sp. Alg239-R121]|uniref:RHS repeat-associated core domain-containing protein n=1 Tax=Pelagibius sp. Alg239-R121 TaxID=2993448 RepID=UPI0024A7202F|nr:RHS repeat-associated core domain-containing protein [Pelagibius sp. Alg239-R121]